MSDTHQAIYQKTNTTSDLELANNLSDGGGISVTVEDTLRSTSTTNALSANMGNVLAKDVSDKILSGNTNTTGATLTTGTFFINSVGQLCKATADIANNATVTLNTNCEAVSVGDELKELNSNLGKKLIATATANQTYSQQLTYLKSYFNALTTQQKQEAYIMIGNMRAHIRDISVGEFVTCEVWANNYAMQTYNLSVGTYWLLRTGQYTNSSSENNSVTIELWA